MLSVETFVGGTSRRLPFRLHANMADQGKVFEMRDEIDGRMWVAHHEQFSQWVGDAAADDPRRPLPPRRLGRQRPPAARHARRAFALTALSLELHQQRRLSGTGDKP